MPDKKPRLSVKSMTDAMQQLRAAHVKISELGTSCEHRHEQFRSEQSKRMAAETDAKNARTEHNDLKKRLLDSETENARLRGYMERVREDDAVADPLVEVDDQHGKRMVSKRYPSNSHQPVYAGIDMASNTTWDGYGNKHEKPKHWITY